MLRRSVKIIDGSATPEAGSADPFMYISRSELRKLSRNNRGALLSVKDVRRGKLVVRNPATLQTLLAHPQTKPEQKAGVRAGRNAIKARKLVAQAALHQADAPAAQNSLSYAPGGRTERIAVQPRLDDSDITLPQALVSTVSKPVKRSKPSRAEMKEWRANRDVDVSTMFAGFPVVETENTTYTIRRNVLAALSGIAITTAVYASINAGVSGYATYQEHPELEDNKRAIYTAMGGVVGFYNAYETLVDRGIKLLPENLEQRYK